MTQTNVSGGRRSRDQKTSCAALARRFLGSERWLMHAGCDEEGEPRAERPGSAIVEPQRAYRGLDDFGVSRILEFSPVVRQLVREKIEPVHPLDPTIRGVSHVMWTDTPRGAGAHGRNAVFYGSRAIDRSPCGTETSARLAHLHAKGRLRLGDVFVHESYIDSRFIGRIEEKTWICDHAAIVPSIEGTAIATGFNQIWIDDEDQFARGFQVA